MSTMAPPKKQPKKSASNPWPARLKAARDRIASLTGKRPSQAETAAKLGLSRRMYIYFESGERHPAGSVAVLLEHFCKTPENF